MYVAEQRAWGVTHAEIGAYLLGLWGLPYAVVEAVANHHAPARVDSKDLGILAATHIADGLVNDEQNAEGATPPRLGGTVDLAYVDKLGLTDKLEGWRESARKQMRAADGSA
jgi:hypothetical protein